ncbi:hypothetical protein [Streptomyces phytophilus]|uniref:hypothetical protein n=1 Tax=Streptomyces phytophilus TaxID=722715 RepID=UPI0015F05C21|nr:hypothetical protein [Streptomyces phytophilus]
MTADEASSLDALAREFADKLTTLTRGVLGEGSPPFHAVNTGDKVRVAPIRDDEIICRIPVSINGEPTLRLAVINYCCFDGAGTFLAVDKTQIHLFFEDVPDPLMRFEYERGWQEPPGAHIQIHAHRDEMAYLLRLSESGRPKRGLNRRKLPKLAEMHLPVGGHRMRPALEDVLLFLKREFDIDTQPGWRTILEERLREWRLVQVKSAVRDAPEAAAEALRLLGYQVEEPKTPHPRRSPEDVKLFWP